ncbi:MAG TPA: hypothetical protein VNK95_15000 [Caldilineaceae bacterium]|nr:hypothetical protein [Caldilineaceae bacterium]
MWGPLTIIDQGQVIWVAPAADPEDWIACFERRPDFPALEWALRMIDLYNAAPLRERALPAGADASVPVVDYHA